MKIGTKMVDPFDFDTRFDCTYLNPLFIILHPGSHFFLVSNGSVDRNVYCVLFYDIFQHGSTFDSKTLGPLFQN